MHDEQLDYEDVASDAVRMPEPEALKLVEHLKDNPEDLLTRAKLLGFHSLRRKTVLNGYSRAHHLLWLINNHPSIPLSGSPYAGTTRIEPEFGDEAKAWQSQCRKFPDDSRVFRNAANFFFHHCKPLAEKFFERAKTLAPEDPDLRYEIAWFYELQSDENVAAAVNALRELHVSIKLRPDRRCSVLNRLAKLSYQTGDFEAARNYATECLHQSKEDASWDYGNLIHDGNMVLGLLALRNDDVHTAKENLLAAGQTPGSPQLDRFGPDPWLAAELLKRNEKDAVLAYLDACARWCEDGVPLSEWRTAIESGAIPRDWSIIK